MDKINENNNLYVKQDLENANISNDVWISNLSKYWDKYFYTFLICYIYLSYVSLVKYIAKYIVTIIIIINKIFVSTKALVSSLGGPSMVDLKYIFDTSIANIAYLTTFGTAGYLTGSMSMFRVIMIKNR